MAPHSPLAHSGAPRDRARDEDHHLDRWLHLNHLRRHVEWSTEGRADGWDIQRVVTEGYERVIWVYKAIETIGKHAGRLPIEIGVGLTEDGEFEQVIEDDPLLRVLSLFFSPSSVVGRKGPSPGGRFYPRRSGVPGVCSGCRAVVRVRADGVSVLSRGRVCAGGGSETSDGPGRV
ncbi:hypothetical protein GCM10010521_75320 [Streptomyces rameus]|uniref:Uncharacterized protein n=1 Tax=Streptomyces rameus TaxID=68261 RepID=A0ABN3VDJ6_9ACTN